MKPTRTLKSLDELTPELLGEEVATFERLEPQQNQNATKETQPAPKPKVRPQAVEFHRYVRGGINE